MKTRPVPSSAHPLHEFLLVLELPAVLQEKIHKVREECCRSLESGSGTAAKAHIGLARFSQADRVEPRIVERLRTIAMGYPPFRVVLKNYGSFPTHSLIFQVESQLAVKKLVRALKSAQHLMKPDRDHAPYFYDTAYISLARKLVPWQYEKGWLEYRHRHFTGSFIAGGMLLLTRRAGSPKFQVVENFDFMNLPVATTQGTLFA